MKEKRQDSIDRLREMISELEVKQEEHGKELKEQLLISYESLKPLNLLKSSIMDLSSSSELKNSVVDNILSILSGYLTQKLIIRASGNPIKRITASLIQIGVTKLIAKNMDFLRDLSLVMVDRLSSFVESRRIRQHE